MMMNPPPPQTSRRGFTLVETVVASTVLLVLAVSCICIVQHARQSARMSTEIHAARNLIAAYLGHAAEHSGQVMAGYAVDPEARNLDGEVMTYPMNARYPWRIAPQLPKVRGVMLFNGNERALDERQSDYLVSVKPNLGLNAILVGGHFGTGSPLRPSPRLIEAYGKFYLSHLAEADDPSSLIVFASARSGKEQPGYFEVRPPRLTGPLWSGEAFDPETAASQHGFVDFRWRGRAVAAMLGGNVELLDEERMRDMRRWSHLAARASERDFTLRAGGGGD